MQRKSQKRAGELRRTLTIAMIAGITFAIPASAQAPGVSPPARTFQEQDGVSVMERFRQALESGSRTRTLKLFDGARMPRFALFRDELAQFFGQYQALRVEYQITQVSQDEGLGAIVAEFAMEALPVTDGLPPLHRRAQMRLVTSWDGKEWKIADLSPRDLFH